MDIKEIKQKITSWASIGFGSDKTEPEKFEKLLETLTQEVDKKAREDEREKAERIIRGEIGLFMEHEGSEKHQEQVDRLEFIIKSLKE